MRKIYTLFIILFISALSAFGQDSYYVSSSGGLNLRKGPGANYATINSIPQGSKIEVLDQNNEEWWKVKYNNQEGYVAAKFLSEEKPSNSAENKPNNNSNSNNNSNKSNSNNNSNTKSNSPSSNNSKRSASTNHNYNYGIGLRAGDPAGLTLIKYLPNAKGLEVNIGRTAFYGYDFKRHFEWNDNFNDYKYVNARFKSALGVQLHYLSFQNINGLDGLQWYYGLGGQVRAFSVEYLYDYKVYYGNGAGDYKWERRWDVAREIDFGIDGTVGLNYHFPTVPISLFTDVTLFGEIYNNPFRFWFQGGLGARYNF